MNERVAVLTSIQVGAPRALAADGRTAPYDRPWTTGIYKTPIDGTVHLGTTGLDGDGQADLVNHGGPDKAVCAYSADHYDGWRAEGLMVTAPGAFGENFTIEGLVEDDICIGDRWAIGNAVVEVSQPRQPCWKLARKWRSSDLVERVVQSGRTGWYFRVRQSGMVAAGQRLTLIERPYPEWSVTAANRVMHRRPRSRDAAAALAAVEALSASWQESLVS
jgi:MOSC domain-containing protein YiiM